MDIWTPSARTVLQLLLSSTDHKFYVSEIQRHTGMSRTTLCPLLETMADNGLLVREEERPNQDSFNRPLRVYYTLKGNLAAIDAFQAKL